MLAEAFRLAEQGNATIAQLLLDQLWLRRNGPVETEPGIYVTPPGEPTRVYRGGREIEICNRYPDRFSSIDQDTELYLSFKPPVGTRNRNFTPVRR